MYTKNLYIYVILLFLSPIFCQNVPLSDSLKVQNSQILELNNEIIDLKSKIIILQDSLDLNKSKFESISDEISSKNEKIKILENSVSQLKNQKEDLAEKELSLNKKEQLLNDSNNELTKNQKIFEEKNNSLQNSITDFEQKQKDVLELQQSLLLRNKEAENKLIEIDKQYSSARTSQLKEMYILYILLASAISIIFLSGFLRQLYLWRKKIDGNSILLPEQVGDDLDKNRKDINLLINKIGELSNISSSNNKLNNQYFIDINAALDPLKNTISSQRDDIKRLQAGYDNQIKKRFIRRLIDLRDRVAFYSNADNDFSSDVIDATKNILKIVDYTFKTEGIEMLDVKPGTSLQSLDSSEFEILEDHAIETDDTKLVGTVKSTIVSCFYLKGSGNNKEIIKKGIIEFFKSKGS